MILCIGTTPAAQRTMVFRRLEREAVNRAILTVDGAAGKAVNVGKVLHVLGEQPLVLGFLGGLRGEEVRGILAREGVPAEFVPVQNTTRQCITLVDETTGEVTELVEEGRPVEPEAAVQFRALIQNRLPGARAVVMSGTIASGVAPGLYAEVIRLAHQEGVFSVVDAQGTALQLALEAQPGLVKPNRKELETTLQRPVPDDAALHAAMRELLARGSERVVVTAGQAPAWAADGRHWWRITAPIVPALNPIGSGDAFTAAVVARLVAGDDLGEACRWGAAAGAANALTHLSGEVRRVDVERLLPLATAERTAPVVKGFC